jgi:hypothetical protein
MNLTPVFNQYLLKTTIPKLELKVSKGTLACKWSNVETNFNMPIDVVYQNKKIRLFPQTYWTNSKHKVKSIEAIKVPAEQFYIDYR